MVRMVLRSFVARCLACCLVAGQMVLGIPVAARPAMPVPAQSSSPSSTPPPAPPKVTVNRTTPRVTPPPAEPRFSASPTVEEIFRARVFAEPLVPVGDAPTVLENQRLADVLRAIHRDGEPVWRAAIAEFLRQHPQSPWRASLLANTGALHLRSHAYARALDAWDEAWHLAKDRTDGRSRAVADFAIAEWLTLAASFGQSRRVEERLKAIQDRPIGGTAGTKVRAARETIAIIKRYPDKTLACGPQALIAILSARDGVETRKPDVLTTYKRTEAGTSLAELEALARRAGLPMRAVAGTGARVVPVPAVVHLKIDHYVAVIARDGDRYRIVDGAMKREYWVHRDTLFDETSGYFLIPSGESLTGWRAITEDEGKTVVGSPSNCDPGSPSPGPPPGPPMCGTGNGPGPGGGGPGNGPAGGCSAYDLQAVTASLLLYDTPAGHSPPRGPAVPLTVSYNHRERLQQQIFSASNMGPKWAFNWMRFVREEPLGPPGAVARVWVYLPPGGQEVYFNPDASGAYPAHWNSRAVLVRVSDAPLRYERRLPDGTVEVYALSDGAPAGQRQVFLTALIDPQGQRLDFTWDAQLRLLAITDAVGQVSTLEYADADPLKVTAVEDPFGRRATFTYNPAGQLASITDIIGITSSFTYGANDFVSAKTTPYGTTAFRHEANTLNDLNFRLIEATDPLGGTEHLEFQYATPSLSATAPAGEVPTGFEDWNTNLDHWNSFYWDKRAWALGKDDLTKATITHWLVRADWPDDSAWSVIPHSVKRPLEGRVWYAYPGQGPGTFNAVGWWREPSRVGRVLADGTSQIRERTDNTFGLPLITTDPLGRQTSYSYALNGVDVTAIRQTTGGMNDLLASYGSFTAHGQPQTMTDAAGATTTTTYNSAGQVLTVTNATNETTTYAYDADGRLTSVTGPVSGATTTYTYDAYGRIRTVTDPDNYTVTTDYDAFDRPIRVTYPDGTYEELTYHRLELATRRDRAGRITRYYYDALKRLIATRDPAGRTIAQEWCGCGSLDALIDANGNRTSWERDLQGRVTREVRADGTTATLYTYEALSGRLKTVTDPKQQVTTYTYTRDDALASTTYTNAVVATPSVSYTYDAAYGRLATMTDGIGLTTYGYHAAGQPGAGQVASVDGPVTDDTITYTYDALGRVTERAINGAANTVAWAFDTLGRVTSEVNVLGTFTYTYDGVTSRVATVAYPNGQTSTYAYFDNMNDRRLQTIHHKYPNGSTLSRFDYAYGTAGNILTWRQQADAEAMQWSYGYDEADQLTSAIKQATDPAQTVLQRFGYAYDPGGNRTVEQIDDQVTGATHDSLNRLVSQQPSGAMLFAGAVSEPATVTVQGVSATVTAANEYRASVPVGSGTNTVNVAATDATGSTATRQYEVDNFGTGRTFTYDANGNMTSDGARTFEWDARNQLVAVNVGTQRSEFAYDGQRRRVRTIAKQNGEVLSDTATVWCDNDVSEDRVFTSGAVIRRLFGQGEQVPGAARLFVTDHLGTVHRVADASAVVLATYSFDAWGRRVLSAGTDGSLVGFTGHTFNSTSALWLTLLRAYDSELGRWISEDPIGFGGGLNLYGYVSNEPISSMDPFGDKECKEDCRITVRCRPVAMTGIGKFANHCYIVTKQGDDVTTVQAGRGADGMRRAWTSTGDAVPPNSPSDRSVYTKSDPDCSATDCVNKMGGQAGGGGRASGKYRPTNTNSNNFVNNALLACGASSRRVVNTWGH